MEEPESPWKFSLGELIWYRDPNEGIASDQYTIIDRVSLEENGYSVYLLSNTRYNLEAYEKDIHES